jgi:hypothetical protein
MHLMFEASHPRFRYLQRRNDAAGTSSSGNSLIVQNGIAQTALLIIANLAGAGILSLPKAIVGAGMILGSIMVVASALLSGYTADVLSRCYDIINSTRRNSRAGASTNTNGHSNEQQQGARHDAASPSTWKISSEPTFAPSWDSHLKSTPKVSGVNEGGFDRSSGREGGSFFARSPYACIGQEAAGPVGAIAVTLAQFMTQFSVMVVFLLISGINLNKLHPTKPPLFYSMICTAALTPLMLLRPVTVDSSWSFP